MDLLLPALGTVLLLGFTALGSFHDVSNAVAVPVRTGALTPRIALVLSAAFNALGMGLGLLVLPDVPADWLQVPHDAVGLGILCTALLAALLLELATWRLGMPSSSTHALLGGILGAAGAAQALGADALPGPGRDLATEVLLPMVLAPLAAFLLAWAAVVPLLRRLRHSTPRTVRRRSAYLLSLGAVVTSLAHGLYFGHRAFVLGLAMALCTGRTPGSGLQAGLLMLLTASIVLGTLGGGWRIGYTFGSRMVQVDALRGAIAQMTTCVLVLATALGVREPFSTSQVAASALLGAGSNQRFVSVRHRTVIALLTTWAVTLPVCALLGAVFFLALNPLLG